MDRIHRLGQHRPVIVTKLVVEDSIESKIVQLQEKKMAMTTAALSRDPEESLGKLTPEDVSGIVSSWMCCVEEGTEVVWALIKTVVILVQVVIGIPLYISDTPLSSL